MRPEDFFIESEKSPFDGFDSGLIGGVSSDPFGQAAAPRFDLDQVRRLRSGPLAEVDDAEAAVALARLVHDDLEAFGTGGGEQLSEGEMRESLLALRAALQRLGISEAEVPFRDYRTFKSYWMRNNGYNSWQARRDILNGIFEPIHDALGERETQALTSTLAEAVSPRGRTGWSRVDEEITELKRHFKLAQTPQDYRNIGNDCVIALEALSRQVYDADRHLREGEEEPAVGKTKLRIERFIEDTAEGSENSALRKLVRAAVDFAQETKHRADGSRREAGVAADSVILVANLLRRLDEDD